MIKGFSPSQFHSNYNDSFSDESDDSKLFVDKNNEINKDFADSALKIIDETRNQIKQLLSNLGVQSQERDEEIIGQFINLSPIHKIMLMLEIDLEIQRRIDKGIKTPYYMDKQFTESIRREYGINLYGSNVMAIIKLISPENLGIRPRV